MLDKLLSWLIGLVGGLYLVTAALCYMLILATGATSGVQAVGLALVSPFIILWNLILGLFGF